MSKSLKILKEQIAKHYKDTAVRGISLWTKNYRVLLCSDVRVYLTKKGYPILDNVVYFR